MHRKSNGTAATVVVAPRPFLYASSLSPSLCLLAWSPSRRGNLFLSLLSLANCNAVCPRPHRAHAFAFRSQMGPAPLRPAAAPAIEQPTAPAATESATMRCGSPSNFYHQLGSIRIQYVTFILRPARHRTCRTALHDPHRCTLPRGYLAETDCSLLPEHTDN